MNGKGMPSVSPKSRREQPADAYVHLAPTTNDHSLSLAERCRIYANRLQFSRQYTYIYALFILVNAGLLTWTVIEADYPLGHVVKFWIFVVSDALVTFFVLFEIIISFLAQGSHVYFSQWHNRFDLAIAALCIAALFGHAVGPVAELELEEEVEFGLLMVRYVAQLARLLMLVKNYRRQARRKTLDIHLDLAADGPDAVAFDDGSAASPLSDSKLAPPSHNHPHTHLHPPTARELAPPVTPLHSAPLRPSALAVTTTPHARLCQLGGQLGGQQRVVLTPESAAALIPQHARGQRTEGLGDYENEA